MLGGMMAARTIEEFANERGIKCLVHFTRLSNLQSILTHGLVPRDKLDRRNILGTTNDQYRLDRTNAVCVSVSFPNYRMFFPYRQQNPQEDWVVIGIKPSALWELRCAFCITNAASGRVANIPIADRTGLGAFQALYGDTTDKTRASLNLESDWPTDPQAEVLMLDGVPASYFLGVAVESDVMKAQVEALFPGLRVLTKPSFYSARRDYSYWQAQQV
ncbi:DUF4433 domain-containing protein [Burkholderia multivorans]|nr:DarT ssDNA thymidine ADP-ribosyltransferase family protein [Burkholderia multivorans]MBU9562036.1 DUF4433 domain-containing protein [Burkholderia multivorans]